MQSTQADSEFKDGEAAQADRGPSASEGPAGASDTVETPNDLGGEKNLLEAIDDAIDADDFVRALLIFVAHFDSAARPNEALGVLLRARAAVVLASFGRKKEAVEAWELVARYWASSGQPARALAAILQVKELNPAVGGLLDHFSALYHIRSPHLDASARPAELQIPDEPVDLTAVDADWASLVEAPAEDESAGGRPHPARIDAMLERAIAALRATEPQIDEPGALPPLPLLSLLPAPTLRQVLEWVEFEIFARGEPVLAPGAHGEDLLWTVTADFCVENKAGGDSPEQPARLRLPSGTLLGLNSFGPTPEPARCEVISHKNGELLRLRRQAVDQLDRQFGDFKNRLTTLRRHSLTEGLLERHPLFTQFERSARVELMGRFTGMRVAKDEVIIEQNGSSPGIFLVLDGRVEVICRTSGDSIAVETLDCGGVFGAIGVVSDRAAMARYAMATPGHLLFLSTEDFGQIAAALPGIAKFAVHTANQRIAHIQAATAQMEDF